jgi:hypothetical protein
MLRASSRNQSASRSARYVPQPSADGLRRHGLGGACVQRSGSTLDFLFPCVLDVCDIAWGRSRRMSRRRLFARSVCVSHDSSLFKCASLIRRRWFGEIPLSRIENLLGKSSGKHCENAALPADEICLPVTDAGTALAITTGEPTSELSAAHSRVDTMAVRRTRSAGCEHNSTSCVNVRGDHAVSLPTH